MGGMLLLGVMVWTVLLLSAVHVSSAGEALSAVDSLPCTGSGCGAETGKWSNFQETALVTGRKLLTTKELDVTNTEKSFADPSVYTTEVTLGTTRHLLAAPPPPRVAPVGRTPWVVNPPSPPRGSKTKKPISPAVSPGA